MKKFIIASLLLAGTFTASFAQAPTTGHVNIQELVALMSEMDSARINLQAYQSELESEMQGMEDEYNTKLTEYQRKTQAGAWTPAVQQVKEKDLQDLVQRIQAFQQTAQQDLQQMQQQLFAPCFQKAQEAIEKVAKENALTYVFDSTSLLYKDGVKSLDILPLAKKVLGIPAEKVAPTQIPSPAAQAAK